METARAISNISEPGAATRASHSMLEGRESVCVCMCCRLYLHLPWLPPLITRSLYIQYSTNQEHLIQPHARTWPTCLHLPRYAAFIQCSLQAVHLWAYVPSHAQRAGISPRAYTHGRSMYGQEECFTTQYSFLGLAYDTDLQEQGSSHPGTCCNKGIAKTATTGTPCLCTCKTPGREGTTDHPQVSSTYA